MHGIILDKHSSILIGAFDLVRKRFAFKARAAGLDKLNGHYIPIFQNILAKAAENPDALAIADIDIDKSANHKIRTTLFVNDRVIFEQAHDDGKIPVFALNLRNSIRHFQAR